ncbi:GntR family transcriptional regulator [Arthrobacter sp. TMT4-20]
MTTTDGTRAAGPLWKRVSADLLSELQRGTFDARFPGELELAQRYGVSRGTIRAALRPLRDAGHVNAHPGRMSRVQAGGNTAFGPLYSLLASVRDSGMEHRSVVLQQEITQSPATATLLSLKQDAEFFHLTRVRFADEEPIALDEVWMPADIAGGLVDSDFTRNSLYGELEKHCGMVLNGGTEQLSAVLAAPEHSRLLQCAAGSPLLLIERTGCHRAQYVEFRRTYVVGDRVEIATNFGCKADPPTS